MTTKKKTPVTKKSVKKAPVKKVANKTNSKKVVKKPVEKTVNKASPPKREVSNQAKPSYRVVKPSRIQTAEGWKRSMLKVIKVS